MANNYIMNQYVSETIPDIVLYAREQAHETALSIALSNSSTIYKETDVAETIRRNFAAVKTELDSENKHFSATPAVYTYGNDGIVNGMSIDWNTEYKPVYSANHFVGHDSYTITIREKVQERYADVLKALPAHVKNSLLPDIVKALVRHAKEAQSDNEEKVGGTFTELKKTVSMLDSMISQVMGETITGKKAHVVRKDVVSLISTMVMKGKTNNTVVVDEDKLKESVIRMFFRIFQEKEIVVVSSMKESEEGKPIAGEPITIDVAYADAIAAHESNKTA